MYWFRRPLYLRYVAAALVLVGAAWIELGEPARTSHPFAAERLTPGTPLREAALEWREIEAGLLSPVDLDGQITRHVYAGAPLLPADVDPIHSLVPAGWWTLEAPLPGRALPGQAVSLILLPAAPLEQARVIGGIVVELPPDEDGFSFGDDNGLVAVPGDDAAEAALAVAEGRVVVLLSGDG